MSDTPSTRLNFLLAFAVALPVALGIAYAGMKIGSSFVAAKQLDRFVRVKGIAEKIVPATNATWRLNFEANDASQQGAYEKFLVTQKAITAYLDAQSFDNNEFSFDPPGASVQTNDKTQAVNYRMHGVCYLQTTKIQQLDAAVDGVTKLISEGHQLGNWGSLERPTYTFSGLDPLRPGMIAEATQSARGVAVEFAKQSQAQLGGIRTASQGAFEVTPLADYYSPRSSDMKLRLVTTVEFFLK